MPTKKGKAGGVGGGSRRPSADSPAGTRARKTGANERKEQGRRPDMASMARVNEDDASEDARSDGRESDGDDGLGIPRAAAAQGSRQGDIAAESSSESDSDDGDKKPRATGSKNVRGGMPDARRLFHGGRRGETPRRLENWMKGALREAAIGGATPEDISRLRSTFESGMPAGGSRSAGAGLRTSGSERAARGVTLLTPEESAAYETTGRYPQDNSEGGESAGDEDADSGGDESEAWRQGDSGEDDDDLPPKKVPEATLERALRRLALAQEEDSEIAADMGKQGAGKPTDHGTFWEWLAGLDEPMVL